MMRSAIHRAMTIHFCAEGGQIRRRHVVVRCWPTNIVAILQWINNLRTFYLACDHFRDMAQPISAFDLVFIGKWSVQNLLMMLSAYTTLNDKKVLPYNTTLKNRDSLILKPRSTLSSTLISMISSISNSLVLVHNCQHAQASNVRIHRLDDSIELKVSILASSTLHPNACTIAPLFVYYV
jgi:hypothetical protein